MGELMKNDLVLSEEEIYEITHRKRPKEQLRDLVAMGIRATLRQHDNTVCVLRAHVTTLAANLPTGEPQLKSSRK